jgi:hypothetical protein
MTDGDRFLMIAPGRRNFAGLGEFGHLLRIVAGHQNTIRWNRPRDLVKLLALPVSLLQLSCRRECESARVMPHAARVRQVAGRRPHLHHRAPLTKARLDQ